MEALDLGDLGDEEEYDSQQQKEKARPLALGEEARKSKRDRVTSTDRKRDAQQPESGAQKEGNEAQGRAEKWRQRRANERPKKCGRTIRRPSLLSRPFETRFRNSVPTSRH
jgi:hypothetical protein